MQVRARFFASCREIVGQGQIAVELPSAATVDDLLRHLITEYPSLERYRPHLMLAVNASYVRSDHGLQEGDEVALIPPVSGGCRGMRTEASLIRSWCAEPNPFVVTEPSPFVVRRVEP